MEDLLIELVSSLGFPVFRQGSLSDDDDYPDTFFTFWNNSENCHSSYDNSTSLKIYEYDLNIYSNDADVAYSKIKEVSDLLHQNNFIVSSLGFDLPSDEPDYIGRGLNISFLGK